MLDECSYLPVDPATGCATPRSCRQCLQKEGCSIGLLGSCLASSTYYGLYAPKYKDAFEQNLTLPPTKDTNVSMLSLTQRWVFPASEVRYCSTDDVVCKRRVSERFWVPEDAIGGDSRFCVGANGCMCIAVCELDPPSDSLCPDSVSAPSSETTPVPARPPTPTPTPSEPSCRYHPTDPTTGCLRYRPCRDCLNIAGCGIDWDGQCEALDAYSENDHYNFRLAFKDNVTLPLSEYTNVSRLAEHQSWRFLTNEVDYCPADDAVYKQCIENDFWQTPDVMKDSRFCVGENGCVCVANCATIEDGESCPTPHPSAGSYSHYDRGGISAASILMILGALAVVFSVLQKFESTLFLWLPPDSTSRCRSWLHNQRTHIHTDHITHRMQHRTDMRLSFANDDR